MANRGLILAGTALLGGGILYWWWRSRQTAAATPAASLPVGATTPLPISPAVSAATNATASGIAAAVAAPPSAAVGQQVPAAVLQYATTLPPNNQAQFNRMLPSMTPDEIAELNNILVNNLWGQDSIKAFWNAWRIKYHILDGTYTNFADAGRVLDLLNSRQMAA